MEIKIGDWKSKLEVLDLYEDEKGEEWIHIKSHYSKVVKEKVIKGLQDVRWMGGPPEQWANNKSKMFYKAPYNSRNKFHLDYYSGKDPYQTYKTPLSEFGLMPRFSKKHGREIAPLPHQVEMANHWWTRKVCHISADMRTGKTLPFLSVAERLQTYTWIIAPRTAVAGIKLEIYNWGINLDPVIMTYNEMESLLRKNSEDLSPPQVIIFDESHYLKNWTTLRTQAAFHVCEVMRQHEYPNDLGYWILGMSGTAVPKNPLDIWPQAEVIRPGYIAEPNVKKLDERLSIIEYRDNSTGGQYPHRVAWREDSNLCGECGGKKEDHMQWDHPFVESKNELRAFGERLKGFTIRFVKSECMDLPDKIMEKVKLKPSREVLQYAKSIKDSGAPAASILRELIELSAGFYYEHVPDETRTVTCPRCQGTKLVEDIEGNKTATCTTCKGNGQVHPTIRVAQQIECPKEQAMIDLLEECEESMRFVGFGAFHGCIDRMTDIALKQGWSVVQVDGRGFHFFGDTFDSDTDALFKFSSKEVYKEKLAYIAHPGSGGTGISLSASPTIMYWCNSFDGGARMQSLERGSDLNMDMSKGCKIVDLIQLSVDQYVLDNLDKKEKLQQITLDDMYDEMETV